MNDADIRAIVAAEVAKATLAQAQQIAALTIAMLAALNWRAVKIEAATAKRVTCAELLPQGSQAA